MSVEGGGGGFCLTYPNSSAVVRTGGGGGGGVGNVKIEHGARVNLSWGHSLCAKAGALMTAQASAMRVLRYMGLRSSVSTTAPCD
jgi:hypothetical protein